VISEGRARGMGAWGHVHVLHAAGGYPSRAHPCPSPGTRNSNGNPAARPPTPCNRAVYGLPIYLRLLALPRASRVRFACGEHGAEMQVRATWEFPAVFEFLAVSRVFAG
jgi:hypothetical protein